MNKKYDENDFMFKKSSLNPRYRKKGISAFMRIKNGADFLKETIESHIPYFDEIIACYNDCSDTTEDILLGLKKKYPKKLKVYHYLPKVHPPGSELHKITSENSVNSLVNFYNYTLSKTTYTIATKLDDDHIAIEKNLKKAITYIKSKWNQKSLLVFSGLNLIKDNNELAIYKNNIFSGNADICFFPVNTKNYYTHDLRYEKFTSNLKQKKYIGLLYYHLKFLKTNYGFSNYNLKNNPNSRYAAMYEDFLKNRKSVSFKKFHNQINNPKNILKKYYKYRSKKILSKLFSNINTYKYDRVVSLKQDFEASQKEIDFIKKL